MHRRRFLSLGVLGSLGVVSGCSDRPIRPELRIRNHSGAPHVLSVTIRREGERVFDERFDVPRGTDSSADVLVENVYASAGDHTIRAVLDDGAATETETVTLSTDDDMTHVDIETDGSIRIGRFVP